ncbi:(dimethylallyl)adenosine tRNA methylthiotransferase [Corchorus olitorius]|uniref:(Dimethylallyl)adenosine tRNA methylthiotransferase n=1 Tax=Corchorus olitorius TaxID=93759 RepID=A0A1R3HXE3_9ROSI|nr:(dimethylallyl)adenosine tRNA methylthiotransferase [Corchorus olitorius]
MGKGGECGRKHVVVRESEDAVLGVCHVGPKAEGGEHQIASRHPRLPST